MGRRSAKPCHEVNPRQVFEVVKQTYGSMKIKTGPHLTEVATRTIGKVLLYVLMAGLVDFVRVNVTKLAKAWGLDPKSLKRLRQKQNQASRQKPGANGTLGNDFKS